ncbi:MAG: Acetyl-coenzyme A carboxyl transferase alpha chain / Acetyl-coenzyme A carboxyl transferase beta chain; Propionyl-CoA carboxylase beta chain, partial [uncultured Solirubrobacteraceae bacterium]
ERLRGRRGRQPAEVDGRRARHRRERQGRPLRAHLRRLQHPHPHLLRRPRLPARHRPGVGRDHPPRREAPLRLHRGDGAEDHH